MGVELAGVGERWSWCLTWQGRVSFARGPVYQVCLRVHLVQEKEGGGGGVFGRRRVCSREWRKWMMT